MSIVRRGRWVNSQDSIVELTSRVMAESIVAFYAELAHTSPKGLMGERPGDKTLLQGTLDMLILKALTRGPMHGYAIVEFIQQSSEDVIRVEEGALYPAL